MKKLGLVVVGRGEGLGLLYEAPGAAIQEDLLLELLWRQAGFLPEHPYEVREIAESRRMGHLDHGYSAAQLQASMLPPWGFPARLGASISRTWQIWVPYDCNGVPISATTSGRARPQAMRLKRAGRSRPRRRASLRTDGRRVARPAIWGPCFLAGAT